MVTKIEENAGVPLYATSFTTPDVIVSGGGGGQGSHGIRNKLVVYKLSGTSLTKTSEYEFPENSDSPTSLAANAEGTVWVGANAPPEAAENQHLQKFTTDEEGKVQWREARNAFKSSNATTYQRATAAAGTAVAAASSDVPGKVVVVAGGTGDAAELEFDFDINDVALSEYDDKERRFVAAVGDNKIEFRNVNKPAHKWARVDAPPTHSWTRAAFIAPNTLIAASTIGKSKGVRLTRIVLGDDSDAQVTTAVAKVPRISRVTAIAAGGDRLAVAAPSGDIVVYDTSTKYLSRSAVLKRVHGFPVTAVAVSSNGNVVSVSLDGSIVVHCGLTITRASLVETIEWVALSALFIALIAILTNYQTILRATRTIGSLGPQLSPGPEINDQGGYDHHKVVQDFLTPEITSLTAVAADTNEEPSETPYPHGTIAVESHILEDDTQTYGKATDDSIEDESVSNTEKGTPKFVEVPLHATHGHGHGPVVHTTAPEAAPTLQAEPEETADENETTDGGHAEL